MLTRFITVAIIATAAAAVSLPATAQSAAPNEEQAYGVELLTTIVGRDGASPYYSGVVSWTNDEGSTETVTAYVTYGRVECEGTYRDEEGVRSIDGPGLIEVSLGQGNNDRYSIKVACPAGFGAPADYSHSFDTYEQPGGTVQLRSDRVTLPSILEGSYSEPYDNGGSIRMTWRLCLTGVSGCEPPESDDSTAPAP